MEGEGANTSAADDDIQASHVSAVDEEEKQEGKAERGTEESEEEEEDDDEGEEERDSGEEEEEDEEDGEEEEDDDDDYEDNDGSDDDGDEEEEDEMEEEDSHVGASQESDLDQEDIPVCPICLDKLCNQDIGSPESCDHQFCMECIIEWSRNTNTCPVDRSPFNIILARHPGHEKVFKRISVEDRILQEEEVVEEEEDTTACEVCNQSDREDRLLLCDGCDLAYHCECLTPPLASVPVEEWFCPICSEVNRQATAAEQATEEAADDPFMLLPRRQIARTRVSERVRQRIQNLRMRRRRPAELESSDDEDVSMEINPAPATSTSRGTSSLSTTQKKTTRRKTTRKKTSKRRTVRKRKTLKKKTTGAMKTPKKNTPKRRRKRKTRRKKRKTTKRKRATPAVPNRPGFSLTSQAFSLPVSRTIKGRIAERLGLSKPPPGRTIPMQRRPGERPIDLKRGDYGTTPLSILGDRDELIAFQDMEDDIPTPEVLPSARDASTVVSSGLSFNIVPPGVKKPIPTSRLPSQPPASFDLLGSIFKEQTMLHMNSSDIHINRDGSLKATKPVKVPSLDKPLPPVPCAAPTSDNVTHESLRKRQSMCSSSEHFDTSESPKKTSSADNSGGKDDNREASRGGENGGDSSAHDSGYNASSVGGGSSGDFSSWSNNGNGLIGGMKGKAEDDSSDDKNTFVFSSPQKMLKDDADREKGAQDNVKKGNSHPGVYRGEKDNLEDQENSEFAETESSGQAQDGNTESTKDEKELENIKRMLENSQAEMSQVVQTAKMRADSDMEEGELSSSGTPTVSASTSQEVQQNEDLQPEAKRERKNRWTSVTQEEEEGEGLEIRMPQEVTTPFSLASFLSHRGLQELENNSPSSSQELEKDREFTFVDGTFARVNKTEVDERDLNRRLQSIQQQRLEERRLMRMYGFDGDRSKEGGQNQVECKAASWDNRESSRGHGRDHDDNPQDGQHRSSIRSRDRDREKRRSRSRERKRSRSQERWRSGSRSKEDRSYKRARDNGEDSAAERVRGKAEKDSRSREGKDSRGKEDKDIRGRDDRSDRSWRERQRSSRDRFARDRHYGDRGREGDDRCREQNRSRSPRDRYEREPGRQQDQEDICLVKAGWRGSSRGGQVKAEDRRSRERTGRGRGESLWDRGGDWHDRNKGGQGRDKEDRHIRGSSHQSDWSETRGREKVHIFDREEDMRFGHWAKEEQATSKERDEGYNGRQDLYLKQDQFQQPPPSLLPQSPYQQPVSIGGNQPPPPFNKSQLSMFNLPPPQIDTIAPTSIPPPPPGSQPLGPSSFQPWIGAVFQQPPPLQQQYPLPSTQQVPDMRSVMVDSYIQPPPSHSGVPNLLNSADLETLKKKIMLLTGGSDPNTPVSGSPSTGLTASVADQPVSTPPVVGDRLSGYQDSGASRFAQTSGNEGDHMDVEVSAPSQRREDFQQRVVDEVKNAIRPFFNSRQISKDEYKEILKKCVPKVCNSGEINQKKIGSLVGAYVKKMRSTQSK